MPGEAGPLCRVPRPCCKPSWTSQVGRSRHTTGWAFRSVLAVNGTRRPRPCWLAAKSREPASPDARDVCFMRGRLRWLKRDKQYAAATEEFDRVLARWPDNSWADDCQLGKLRIAERTATITNCACKLADEFPARFPDSPLRAASRAGQRPGSVRAGQICRGDRAAHPRASKAALRGIISSGGGRRPLVGTLGQRAGSIAYARLGHFAAKEAQARRSLNCVSTKCTRAARVPRPPIGWPKLAYAAG